MIKKYKLFEESLLDKIKGPDEFEIWKNLGYDKTFDTSEDFINYILNEITFKHQTTNTENIFYQLNNNIVFEFDNIKMNLFVSYNLIWKILSKIFKMSYGEIENFIYKKINEKFKNSSYTPCSSEFIEYLRWKDIK